MPLSLISDQAVPLALLVAEAGANAVKYAGAAGGEAPSIRVSLTATGPDEYKLVVENSVDPERPLSEVDAEGDDEGGLGMQLIRAFVMQLNGTIVTEEQDGIFRLVVSFRAAPDSEENLDVLAATRRRRSRIPEY